MYRTIAYLLAFTFLALPAVESTMVAGAEHDAAELAWRASHRACYHYLPAGLYSSVLY